MAIHLLYNINKAIDMRIECNSSIIFHIILLDWNTQSCQFFNVKVILQFFLQVIAEWIVESSFYFLLAQAQTRYVASQALCEQFECLFGQTLPVQTFEHELIVVCFGVIYNQSVSEYFDDVQSISAFVEHPQNLFYFFQISFSFVHNFFNLKHNQFNSSNFFKFLEIPLWELWLLLYMNTTYFIEEFILLILLYDTDENSSLNNVGITNEMEFNPPEKQTNKLLSLFTLKVYSNNNRHLYYIFLNKQDSQIFSPLCKSTALPVEHFLQYFEINGFSFSNYLHSHFQHCVFSHSDPRLISLISCSMVASSLAYPPQGSSSSQSIIVVFLLQSQMGSSTARLLLIGLDNAGKSTILARLLDPQSNGAGITPTIGYKKDKFSRCGIDFQVLDMSGQSKYRDLWQSNATGGNQQDKIQGIIFVVDSSDRMRIRVAKSELDMILQNKYIPASIPFLFYANKNDMKGACPLQQVEQLLELKQFKRQFQCISCSGTTGRGIQQGIEWLCNLVRLKLQNRM